METESHLIAFTMPDCVVVASPVLALEAQGATLEAAMEKMSALLMGQRVVQRKRGRPPVGRTDVHLRLSETAVAALAELVKDSPMAESSFLEILILTRYAQLHPAPVAASKAKPGVRTGKQT